MMYVDTKTDEQKHNHVKGDGEMMQFDTVIPKPAITERFTALSRVGMDLLRERDEKRLLQLIAQAACELTGASFAAFSLRPVSATGQPLVPSEGSLFHLAAVVGVTRTQEELFRRSPLGGEGLLAPIFRHGVSVRVNDMLEHLAQTAQNPTPREREKARELAAAYAHGKLSAAQLRAIGIPQGHPLPRSFLGVPILDPYQQVRGGLLLGHESPDRFTAEDELLLIGLAAQAAVAMENVRLAQNETQRALLQHIIDHLPSSVYLVRGPDARLILANRAAATVMGAEWQPGQTLQEFLTAQQIRILQVDGRPLPFERLATIRAVRHNETIYQHQEVIRHPDGTTLPVLVNAVALDIQGLDPFSPEQQVPANFATENVALVVHQDVSALKETEQLKDDFISIAAHELRTPLAVLKGFAQTLIIQSARQHGPELVDWQLEALVGIDQATGRMAELVDDLLDVSRLQAGRFTLHPLPTDLVALMQRVITRLQLTTERHLLTFHTEADCLVAKVDPLRIEQVVTNLLTNAIKYSPDGGTIHLQLVLHRDGKQLQISIHDEGIGIPLAQQAQIFGRFARAENGRTHGIGGTGLGLYLCRELVEQHRGHIWFESTEDVGSTFFITLPLRLEEQETQTT